MKKILLIGHSGFYNRGCEAIVRGTVEIIKRYVPDSTITLFSGTPDLDANIIHKSRIQVDSVMPSNVGHKKPSLRWLWQTVDRRILSANLPFQVYLQRPYYKNSDVVISIGGDNFSEDYGGPCRFFESLRCAQRLGKKTVIWGASIGPFTKDIKEWTAILKQCDLIIAREDKTVEYLKSLGCVENVKRVSDPAFCMAAQKPNAYNISKCAGNLTVGLGISDLIPKYKISRERYYAVFADFINYLVDLQNASIILIPHVISSKGKCNDDFRACNELAEHVGTGKIRQILSDTLNAPELKYCISQCDFFIGGRTHSTIASLSTAVPTGSIGYSVKAAGINLDLLGSEEYVIADVDLSSESLIKLFEKMKTNQSAIVKHLRIESNRAKELAFKAGQYLAELIG